MANLHCAAATENFLALEHHSVDVPWWDDLVTGPREAAQPAGLRVAARASRPRHRAHRGRREGAPQAGTQLLRADARVERRAVVGPPVELAVGQRIAAFVSLALFAPGAAAVAQVAVAPKDVAVDAATLARLRSARDTFSPVMEVLRPARTPATDAQLAKLKTLPIEAVWGAVQRQKHQLCFVNGLQTTQPQTRLAGRALTMRYLPVRPDLQQAVETLAKEGDWDVGFNMRASDDIRPGDVLVVEAGRRRRPRHLHGRRDRPRDQDGRRPGGGDRRRPARPQRVPAVEGLPGLLQGRARLGDGRPGGRRVERAGADRRRDGAARRRRARRRRACCSSRPSSRPTSSRPPRTRSTPRPSSAR